MAPSEKKVVIASKPEIIQFEKPSTPNADSQQSIESSRAATPYEYYYYCRTYCSSDNIKKIDFTEWAELVEKSTELSSLRSEMQNNNAFMTKLQKELETLQQMNNKLERSVAQKEDEKLQLESSIRLKDEQHQKEQCEMQQSINKQQLEYKEMLSKNQQEFKTTVQSIQQDANQKQIDRLKEEYETRILDIQSVNMQVQTRLNSDVDSLKETIAQYKNDVQQVRDEHSQLKAKYQILENDNVQYSEEIKRLQDENALLSSELHEYRKKAYVH